MEIYGVYGLGITCLLLIAGIVLTVITVHRMITGRISLPRWAKLLLTAAMILSLLIVLLSMLPPLNIPVDKFFVNEQTHIVTPVESVTKD